MADELSLPSASAVVAAHGAASTQQGIPNHVSQETIIKQSPPDGLKAGSGACDAPQQTGRDDCHYDGRDWLAAPLGPRLFDSGGAQKARPDARVIANDILPKRKGRPGRKVA
jgi:hypothetical protein